MRSVVKHKYLNGRACKAKAKAHVKYLEHRHGPDREKGGREFFNAGEERISGKEVRAEIQERDPSVVHKLILSPGMEGVDLQAYTREIMHEMERHKGVELNWNAVVHKNTEHEHVHVVLYTHQGQNVLLNKGDYQLARLKGDQYLERHHELERYMQKMELEREQSVPAHDREGDKVYQGLLDDVMGRQRNSLELDDAERKKKLEREAQDIDEHRKLDKDISHNYQPPVDRQRGKGKEQHIQESRGRLTDAHLDYGHAEEIKRLQDLALQFPERAEEISLQMEALKAEHMELKQELKPWREFDILIGYDLDRIEERDVPDRGGPELPVVKDPLAEIEREHSAQEGSQNREQESREKISSGDDDYKAPLEDFDYSIDDDSPETEPQEKERSKGADAIIGVQAAELENDFVATEQTLQQEYFENTNESREEPEIDDGFDRGLG